MNIDNMRFGFIAGHGTTEAIFLREVLGQKGKLHLAFVDLEKAFDRVPGDVVW